MGCKLCKQFENYYTTEHNARMNKIMDIDVRLERTEKNMKETNAMLLFVVEYLDLKGGHSQETDEKFEKRVNMRRREGVSYGMRYTYDLECDKEEKERWLMKELQGAVERIEKNNMRIEL